MPFTVITLRNVPVSLKGELSRWMQEIAVGVFVGNINVRVRDELWSRIHANMGVGEATLSYSARNELGYLFDITNSNRVAVDYDGIPLIKTVSRVDSDSVDLKLGFSKVAKFNLAKKHTKRSGLLGKSFIVLDIETEGIDAYNNKILEVGAIKFVNGKKSVFQSLIKYTDLKHLPDDIVKLTGITIEQLDEDGCDLDVVLKKLLEFIGDLSIIGYNVTFDLKFLNINLDACGMRKINNKFIDLMYVVKKDNMFLRSYTLQNVLVNYGIEGTVEHRALSDVDLIYKLLTKLNKKTIVL